MEFRNYLDNHEIKSEIFNIDFKDNLSHTMIGKVNFISNIYNF
jgi:hypothetical protein